MPLNGLALCTRALLKLGAQPIAAFDEGTAEATVASTLYPGIRDALLCAHPWDFATGQAPLGRLTATPSADYAHAFQLPPDLLRAISAGTGGRARGVPYRIAEERLWTDADAVVLTYVFRPDEAEFPPHFVAALVARLAAEFCVPLTEADARAGLLYRLADAELRVARQVDSQQDTPRGFDSFPLIAARG